MATTLYILRATQTRHGVWSKGHVPAIREAFKGVVRVQKLGEHGLAGLRDASTESISSITANDWRGGSLMMPRDPDATAPLPGHHQASERSALRAQIARRAPQWSSISKAKPPTRSGKQS